MKTSTIKTEESFSIVVNDGQFVFCAQSAWDAWNEFFTYFGG